jgi:hypothetical protein
MSAALQEEAADKVSAMPVKARIGWYESKLDGIKTEMRRVRFLIQSTKFGMIMGKTWFSDATTRENLICEVDGFKVTFDLSEEKVAI